MSLPQQYFQTPDGKHWSVNDGTPDNPIYAEVVNGYCVRVLTCAEFAKRYSDGGG